MNNTETTRTREFINLEGNLINEKSDLRDKCERLERWLAVHQGDRLTPDWIRMMDLMYEQLSTMRHYEALLSMRIELHHMNANNFH